jgi:hypothetical protein
MLRRKSALSAEEAMHRNCDYAIKVEERAEEKVGIWGNGAMKSEPPTCPVPKIANIQNEIKRRPWPRPTESSKYALKAMPGVGQDNTAHTQTFYVPPLIILILV